MRDNTIYMKLSDPDGVMPDNEAESLQKIKEDLEFKRETFTAGGIKAALSIERSGIHDTIISARTGIGASSDGRDIPHLTSSPCISYLFIDEPYYICGGYKEEVIHNYLDRALTMENFFMWCKFYDPADPGNPSNYNTGINGNTLLPQGPGPAYNANTYNPISSGFFNAINNPATIVAFVESLISASPNDQIWQDINMIRDLAPKMITTLGFWGNIGGWGTEPYDVTQAGFDSSGAISNDSYNNLAFCCTAAKVLIPYMHATIDNDIIFQASMFEIVDNSCANYLIPDVVLRAFKDEIIYLAPSVTSYDLNLYYTPGVIFDYSRMGYNFSITHARDNNFDKLGAIGIIPLIDSTDTTPDITQLEARMWFYFLATQYIDAGFEALHFGDVFQMDYMDRNTVSGPSGLNLSPQPYTGHYYYWDLISKIRSYAATHARRGIVICGGTASPDFYYDPPVDPSMPPDSITNPITILPNWKRQLIFDVHRNKLPYSSYLATYDFPSSYNPYNGCSDDPVYYPAVINNTGDPNDQVAPIPLYAPIGGMNWQQWLCKEIAYYLDFDNTAIYPPIGCLQQSTFNNKYDYQDYGLDVATWFALQSNTNRNLILRYTYYRIKSLDIYGHLLMPGRFFLTNFTTSPPSSIANIYRANTGNQNAGYTGVTNQQVNIKAIYNGVFSMPAVWVPHNFTNENLTDGPDIGPMSNLVFSGANKAFYIGTDNYIHGYINVNPGYNSGTWITVSPTYAAASEYGQSLSSQVMAKSNLVASPDGSMLLYIGIDNYLHAFNIIDEWSYYYYDFNILLFQSINIYAINSLIYPLNDRIYFAGNQIGSSNLYIFGLQFYDGDWIISNPSISAATNWGTENIPINLQTPSNNTFSNNGTVILSYTKSRDHDRLYYVANNGYYYYFEVYNYGTFFYKYIIPANNYNLDIDSISIASNLAINFDANSNNIRIYFTGNSPLGLLMFCITDYSDYIYYLSTPNETYVTADLGYIYYPFPGSTVSVSPDGCTIVYLCYFRVCFYYFDGLSYYQNSIEYSIVDQYSNPNIQYSSMQFYDNNDLYLLSIDIANDNENYIIHIVKEEPFDNNPCIAQWPLPLS